MPAYSSSSSATHVLHSLNQLSDSLQNELSKALYTSPEGSRDVDIKATLQSLISGRNFSVAETQIEDKVRDFVFCCSALASASNSTTEHLSWVPGSLSVFAISALKQLADAYYACAEAKAFVKIGEIEFDLKTLESEKSLVIEMMPVILPLLKDKIKESAIDASDENDAMLAASAKVPGAYAIVAAYQFRWLISQVEFPYLGKLCPLMIPCGLTSLDHWSPEVKGQGMMSFIHLAKNVNAAEISWFQEVILDACCQNVACDEEIWCYLVEMSVLLVTLTQQSNPRSPWYEKLLNEMLLHLERQPRNKQRRVLWLKHIETLFNGLGLILLAHFRRIFPLFFKWIHVDDDETVILVKISDLLPMQEVLERIKTVLTLTWIRNSPYTMRLVDELVTLYKEAALKSSREEIRGLILQILVIIQQSHSTQFQATWDKYKDDPNLGALKLSSEKGAVTVI